MVDKMARQAGCARSKLPDTLSANLEIEGVVHMSFQSRAIALCLGQSRHLHPWSDKARLVVSSLDPADQLSLLGHYSRSIAANSDRL